MTLRECRRLPVKGPDSTPEVRCFVPICNSSPRRCDVPARRGDRASPRSTANTRRLQCVRTRASIPRCTSKADELPASGNDEGDNEKVGNYCHGLVLGQCVTLIFLLLFIGSFPQHRQRKAANRNENKNIGRDEHGKQNQATSVTEASTSGTAAPRADLDDRTALQETLHAASDLAHPQGRGPPAQTAAGHAVSESATGPLER